jgi:ribonuclease P protein component
MRVRRLGKSYAHPLIVLIALPNQLEGPRFGVTAGQSLGNAVKRNRAKRRLRAAVQPNLESVVPGWDIILIARRPVLTAAYLDIQSALTALLKRAGLLIER